MISSEEDDDEFVCDFYCDTCDRDFNTNEKYQIHLSEHTICGLDGCTFTAHEKIVQKHIEMQHKSGLYDRIKQLQKPEEIEKWIEERKKNYPSKENVDLRRKKQEEMIQRGEILGQNKSRFGNRNEKKVCLQQRNNVGNRSFPKTTNRKNRNKRKVTSMKFKFDDKSDWNGNLPPFGGTSELYDNDSDAFSDDEWQASESTSISKSGFQRTSETVSLNNALGALMGAYNSDYSDYEDVPSIDVNREEDISKPIANNDVHNAEEALPVSGDNFEEVRGPMLNVADHLQVFEDCEKTIGVNDTDEDVPTEVKIERMEPSSLAPEKAAEDILRNSRKRKHVKRKFSRKFAKGKVNETVVICPERVPQKQKADFNKQTFKKRRITLLEKLLEKDIIHERNAILQCVRYIVINKFFDKPSVNKNNCLTEAKQGSLE